MLEPLVSPFKNPPDHPLPLFQEWWESVNESGQHSPDAMCLATACISGKPAVRFVLLKAIDEKGVQFFTNLNSPKARDLEANPFAALAFYWGTQERQIRIEGSIEHLTREENEAYWKTRPRGSQVASRASLQSSPLAQKDEFRRRIEEVEKEFSGKDIPCPNNWGGYRLVPTMFEFWQGRLNREHDRLRYKVVDETWSHSFLYP